MRHARDEEGVARREERHGQHAGVEVATLLHGQRRGHRRLWRRLARAPEAVAGRPVWAGLLLGMPSCPEPPGAP
eukprot:scaffold66930_cov74-Phaeocystis_antarctica.AAC.1